MKIIRKLNSWNVLNKLKNIKISQTTRKRRSTLIIFSLVFKSHLKNCAKNTIDCINIICTMFAWPIYDSDINYTSILQKAKVS